MTVPAHQQAMMKIAANITSLPASTALPMARGDDRGLRVALYYATARSSTRETHCHYLLKYPSGGHLRKKTNSRMKQVINAFVVDGMTAEEIASEVVIRAIGKIIESNVGTVKVYVEQEELRPRFIEALPLFPDLRLLEPDDFEGSLLCQYAKARVLDRAQTHEKNYMLKFNRAEGLKRSGLMPERTVHIDASFGIDSECIGYGYVIKDEINLSGGRKTWRITYGSNTAFINPENGSTGAELRAIRDTLSTTGALDKDIRENHRALTVYSDSLWSTRIIKAKLRGTVPKIDHEVLPYWNKMAWGVTAAVGCSKRVNFEWVKGHSGDILNHAADRLAVAARRVRETGASFEEHAAMKKDIVREMVLALEGTGLMIVAKEHPKSAASAKLKISHQSTVSSKEAIQQHSQHS